VAIPFLDEKMKTKKLKFFFGFVSNCNTLMKIRACFQNLNIQIQESEYFNSVGKRNPSVSFSQPKRGIKFNKKTQSQKNY
jgi:hypothetical protein